MPEQSYPEIATKSLSVRPSVRPEMPPFFASPLFAMNGNKMNPFNFCYVGTKYPKLELLRTIIDT